jgi:hypothetical protein
LSQGEETAERRNIVPDVGYLNLKFVGLLRLLQRCVYVLRLEDGLLTKVAIPGGYKEMSSIFSDQ